MEKIMEIEGWVLYFDDSLKDKYVCLSDNKGKTIILSNPYRQIDYIQINHYEINFIFRMGDGVDSQKQLGFLSMDRLSLKNNPSKIKIELSDVYDYIDKEPLPIYIASKDMKKTILNKNTNILATGFDFVSGMLFLSKGGKEVRAYLTVKDYNIGAIIFQDLDNLNNTIIVDCKYCQLRQISQSYFLVGEYNTENYHYRMRYGLLNTYGKVVVPCMYDDIRNVRDGYYDALKDEKWHRNLILPE